MTTSAAHGVDAYDTQVARDEDAPDEVGPGGGRARRRRAGTTTRKDQFVQGEAARVPGARVGIVMVGVVTIVISAWGALIPFVEPIFGYHATGTPSWHWNAAHTLLAVVPGAVGVVMGCVVLWAAGEVAVGRGRMSLMWAGLITILSGAWFIVGPRAWPAITTHGVYFAPATPLRGLVYQVGYALGTGVLLVLCGGYVVGWASRPPISGSAAVSSDLASAPKAVGADRVGPRTTSAQAPAAVDGHRRDPHSAESLVQQLLNRRE